MKDSTPICNNRFRSTMKCRRSCCRRVVNPESGDTHPVQILWFTSFGALSVGMHHLLNCRDPTGD